MPHASEDGGAAGEDACSSDELIVFKDEDGGEDVVKRSSDKVTEEKSDLIDLSESEKVSSNHRCSPVKTSSSTPDLNRSNVHTEHVLNTLDGWRFSESDRKNVILGGDDGGGVGGSGGGGSGSRRGGGR